MPSIYILRDHSKRVRTAQESAVSALEVVSMRMALGLCRAAQPRYKVSEVAATMPLGWVLKVEKSTNWPGGFWKGS